MEKYEDDTISEIFNPLEGQRKRIERRSRRIRERGKKRIKGHFN
jgi:hypothetical protein